MSSQRCDGCGKRVRIGGGIGDFWTLERGSSQGMELELSDGSEWFLCFECIDQLPDDRDVTADDVEALGGSAESRENVDGGEGGDSDNRE